jgi:hypothetical protein
MIHGELFEEKQVFKHFFSIDGQVPAVAVVPDLEETVKIDSKKTRCLAKANTDRFSTKRSETHCRARGRQFQVNIDIADCSSDIIRLTNEFLEIIKIPYFGAFLATVDDYIREDYSGQMTAKINGLFPMASELAYIQKRFVHRDIKPANVLISPRFVLKISDFGFCRTLTNFGNFSTSNGLKAKRHSILEYLEMKGRSEDEIKAHQQSIYFTCFSDGERRNKLCYS